MSLSTFLHLHIFMAGSHGSSNEVNEKSKQRILEIEAQFLNKKTIH